ncbi:hypothetical protein N9N67_11390 [Bacteriovoracaceae bacterium]|nr:hypothetical protein [Bacteriovoracaceae bacterium]
MSTFFVPETFDLLETLTLQNDHKFKISQKNEDNHYPVLIKNLNSNALEITFQLMENIDGGFKKIFSEGDVLLLRGKDQNIFFQGKVTKVYAKLLYFYRPKLIFHNLELEDQLNIYNRKVFLNITIKGHSEFNSSVQAVDISEDYITVIISSSDERANDYINFNDTVTFHSFGDQKLPLGVEGKVRIVKRVEKFNEDNPFFFILSIAFDDFVDIKELVMNFNWSEEDG